MSLTTRPLASPRSLQGLAVAIEQQSRVWLPLQMAGGTSVVSSVLLGSSVAGLGLWMFIFSSAERGESSPLFGIFMMGYGVFLATRGAQRRPRGNHRRGWEVSFEQRTLTPVGLSGYSMISLGPDFSLGCYLGSDGDREPAWQLELRHARRGPVATLMLIPVGARGAGDPEVLDRCVNRLAERLGIRRSGASLHGPSDSVKRNSP